MKELGVGIVGTGWVSGEHIQAFQQNPHTEVVALMSRDRSRARAKAASEGLDRCAAYDDLDALLADPGVDIVSLCTAHHLHAEQAMACAHAGKHVLIEKPVALDLESLRALEEAVRSSGVKTLVSFVLRWNPLFETLRALLADQIIGELFYAEVDYFHGIGPWYAQHQWNIRREMGGSSLLTAGCHAVDGLRWFLQKEAVEVTAYANTSRRNPLGYEYEPNSVTLLKFADGALGKVASSVEYVGPYVFNILLCGDQGTIRNNQVFTRRWPGQRGWATIPTVLPDSGDVTHHPFQAEVTHFVECIREGRESHSNLADAVQTHEICLASELSAREGRPVRLEELRGKRAGMV